jgi:uncharacterized protein (TIGR00255 family)
MTVSSMTGFARTDGHAKGLSWYWEVKSVNSRSLDVRARLPQGLEGLEGEIKSLAQERFNRGSLQVSLELKSEFVSRIRVNEDVLSEVLALAKSLQKKHKLPPPSIEGLLSLRGVLETIEPSTDEKTAGARRRLLLSSLKEAFEILAESRRAEGERLHALLLSQIQRIRQLADAARDSPSRSPDNIRARLREQIERLLTAGNSFDADRLHQEALLMAARSDIQEELDRIFAHVAAALELLSVEAGAVGRKLDFLAQEFHREANTLCAKSQDKTMSAIGLSLKATIDQMREQVQNIE